MGLSVPAILLFLYHSLLYLVRSILETGGKQRKKKRKREIKFADHSTKADNRCYSKDYIILRGDAWISVFTSNPNHPGPCVCKYDTNIGAHLKGPGVFHLYRN